MQSPSPREFDIREQLHNVNQAVGALALVEDIVTLMMTSTEDQSFSSSAATLLAETCYSVKRDTMKAAEWLEKERRLEEERQYQTLHVPDGGAS